MKKIVTFLVLFALLIIQFFILVVYWYDTSSCYKKTFTVSWYYSPLKWQSFYYRWDYESEIRLNWSWIRWASWKKVFNWMIAAPKNYAFWTKIILPWYWVWEVSDRWWAIVNAWVRWNSFDRIDLWLWHWETWLKRALSFWMQKMEWYICSDLDSSLWLDYDKFHIYDNFFQSTFWWIALSQWRTDAWVTVLQSYLNKLWYVQNQHITWYFWPLTKQSVCNFQVDKWLLSAYSELCWVFWPTTRAYLRKELNSKWLLNVSYKKKSSWEELEKELPVSIETKVNENEIQEVKELVYYSFSNFYRAYNNWEQNEEIEYLQKYLMMLWFYEWEETWLYDQETIDAVFNLQLRYWLLSENDDVSLRGYLWPNTRHVLNQLVKQLVKQ